MDDPDNKIKKPVLKLPWKLWPTHWSGGWGIFAKPTNRIHIEPERGGGIVAYVEHHGTGRGNDKYPTSEDYDRAALIVKGANYHDRLVDVLMRVHEAFGEAIENSFECEEEETYSHFNHSAQDDYLRLLKDLGDV